MAKPGQRMVEPTTSVGAVGKQMTQPRKQIVDGADDEPGTTAILHISGVDSAPTSRPSVSVTTWRVAQGSLTPTRSQVGSRTGAPVWVEGFRPRHVSSPLHVERSVRISRTALPHLLHVKAYWTYPAGATFGLSRRTR